RQPVTEPKATTSTTTLTRSRQSSELDLISVLKASQTLSSEIILSNLLEKMMQLVLENAGAERGMLLEHRPGKVWVIQAEGDIQTITTALQNEPIAIDENKAPLSIINYVAHTKEALVLTDATQNSTYNTDRYIQTHSPKSILCFPLLNQGRLAGMAYLENNLTPGAFTPDRVEVLNILSSQMIISVENAQLYTNLERSLDLQMELSQAYSRFVPHEYLDFLQKAQITDVNLGDHVFKEMAVLFSDIRAFTTISETMTSQENFNFVNAYLKRVSPKIRDNQGFIVKYLGDGMMAVFPDGVNGAVKAGIEMLKAVYQYNLDRIADGWQPIRIGLGVHIGPMMVGMVGEASRMQGDAFSDHVNLAARLEGLTKFYGVSFLVTSDVVNHLSNPAQYHIRFLDRVIVKGRQEPITIYEVFDYEPPETIALKVKTQATFSDALHYYKKGDVIQAKAQFEVIATLNPNDSVAMLYLKRIEQLRKQGLPDDWTGVWSLSEK
ncbi:MAG: adenylate/guanylate cyclase domain-containing protein, partial [Chloroflexota bacterium]